MPNMQGQLFQQYFDQAKAAQQQGRMAEAKRLYRSAAETALETAKESSGSARELWVERAKKLIQLSEALPAAQASGGKAAAQSGAAAQEPLPQESLEDLQKELDSFIGLTVIKDEVNKMIDWIKLNKLRQAQGLPTGDLSMHMVFSGNPGTGKTTIARLMGRIYRSLGVLSKGQLIEVDRSSLVAGYVGQTAIKTGEVIEKALGGVLFIDEAYALTNRGGMDYGQEAVDTLLKAMEDHREDLVVIVAGYTELMEEFVHSNPGLESRFNRFMHFPDYTVEEMTGIFRMRCEKSGYTMEEEAWDELKKILEQESRDVESFGNARGVRNLFERAISAQADRLAQGKEEITKDSLMRLKSADLWAAIGKKPQEETKEQAPETEENEENE